MDRVAFLRSFTNPKWRGLEIGPSYSPIVPKRSGANIETIDYLDAEGLRTKYAGNPIVDIGNIEEVDYVVKDGNIARAVGKTNCYDYILASHVIEHVPDLIGFLVACQNLLKASGTLILAIPDKRCCFDVFQPLSSTGSILQAHFDSATQPSLGTVFDDLAYNGTRNDAIGWSIQSTDELRFFHEFPAATKIFREIKESPTYHDVHVWRFVPSSFRLIIKDLAELGEILLKEKTFHDTVGIEFFLTLSQKASGCNVDRITLAKRMILEQRENPV
jgi:predicted SAM-dependent methyltransferase